MLLLHLAVYSVAATCALSVPLVLLREPDSTSNDPFVSGLNSEDPGSALLGFSFTDGLSSLLHTGVGETIEAGLAGTGPPRLPATRVTLNFGISVDVGELPETGENGSRSAKPSSLTNNAGDLSLAPLGIEGGDEGDAEPVLAAPRAMDA